MRPLGRFVIRAATAGKGDVILGVLFKNQNPDLLAPNHIYEIREVLGVLTLVDLGPAAIGNTPETSHIPGVSWFTPFGDIPETSGGRFILTRDEIQRRHHDER